MRHIRRLGWLSVVLLALARPSLAEPLVLIPTNVTWSYFPGTSHPSPASPDAWRLTSFQDSTWPQGPATFWYGEPDRFAGTGTLLSDMQNNYSTLFLRRRFSIVNPAAWDSLQLTAMCDDGFQAWINGHPVAALRPPTGEPAHNSLAGGNAPEPAAFELFPIELAPGLLVAGDNVLAVQVFNTSLGSSDLVFDAELSGEPSLLGPPTLSQVDPPPGPVTNLQHITVVFSEPVRGVQADTFLVNGASATSVSGSGTTYTFTFSQPPYGQVEISWATFHTITDFEEPPQRFELAAPGSTWDYELLDPIGPSVLVRQPPAGLTVASLAQVEVTFDKAVAGIDASDLTLNGLPATAVSGIGAGPYLFEFPFVAPGEVTVAWSPGHAITSDALEPHPFSGGPWNYVLDPNHPTPPVLITEFMAETFTAYRDEDQDPEDWIELHNPGTSTVSLEGWSLSNADDDPGRWVFPAVDLAPGGYLVVFASAKDRRTPSTTVPLHTNFKLNPNGGYLGLFSPELPRKAVSELRFPAQGPDYSYGRQAGNGEWRYFQNGSPGVPNPASTIAEAVEEVHFSVRRGFFNNPFDLTLHCPTPGASIRFTTNGSPPSAAEGFPYTGPIRISSNRVIRAAAFKPNALPSRVITQTYLMNLPATRLRLPALSLVTATNHLYGRNGIMEVSPRNTTKRGPAWERPVSVEYIRVEDNDGFQADCGLRIQGGDYVRGQYNYRSTSLPFSKYSFRLYFRGEYGQGRLDYPLFPETTQRSFDTVVLRAGMNDHSNPYLTDEFVRSLARDCGQPASVGTFVHLFLNGVYKGYYNPCERYDVDFLRAYHGGGEAWDVMAQFGEVREGTASLWNTLRTLANTRDLAVPANYLDISSRLDVTNFVDYLCPLIYVDNDDWPHNNWRAARERVPGALYRLYVWDAEWACGLVNGHGASWNTIANQLSSTSPPWGGTDIQRLFLGLKKSPEFRLLFADRVHRHFFNDGALTDERIRARYISLTNRLNGVVSGFNNRIATTWIPQRRRYVLQHFDRASLLASSNAPAFSQHGGVVPTGFQLAMTNLAGSILYTVDGSDPRVAFTGAITPGTHTYLFPIALEHSVHVRARTLQGTNWSALTEATFEVSSFSQPLRLTEIMFNPPGGDAFEFLELANLGPLPVDVSGFSFRGIEFRFPEPSPPIPAGERWILASDARPADFQARYPGVIVAGWFGGSLNNAGERLELLDRSGRIVAATEYSDSHPWPAAADGGGSSLELVQTDLDPNDPAAWIASPTPGGTPGAPPPALVLPPVRLAEIVSAKPPSSDWVELHNSGPTPVALDHWGLTDNDRPHRFRFPPNTTLPAGARLRLWCDSITSSPGLHTGFGLDASGETLALYDAATNRIDVVSFGFIPDGYGLGRLDTDSGWQLTEPTPEAPNEPATLASPSDLAINEWLSNPSPGDDDWIEFHNRNGSHPVALRGLTLALDGTRTAIGYPTFVPPVGFLVFRADQGSGPDHLGLRLPAGGGHLTLHDTTGATLSAVTLSSAAEGLSYGRLPDGADHVQAFPGSASPGASNYAATARGPRFNEWMSRNQGSVINPEGLVADWIELHNPDSTAFDLTGYRLRVGDSTVTEWTFPPGLHLAPGAFLVLWCDPTRPASLSLTDPLYLGRGLPSEGGSLELLRANGQIIDAAQYGRQLPDFTVGRTGSTYALLAYPTPDTANAGPATLGTANDVRLNEWLAHSRPGDSDWLELFNPLPLPVELSGHILTDDPSLAGASKHPLPPLSFLPPLGYARWLADGDPHSGSDHLAFSLDAFGETIRLLTPARIPIDSVATLPQPEGISTGRFPDGSDDLAEFPASPSPASGNWLPHPAIVINELLAHTDPPLEDAVELFNSSRQNHSLAGWWLSDDALNLDKFRIAAGTVISPDGFHVLYENAFNPPASNRAFNLNSAHGGDLWLSEVDASGLPTGYRAHAAFDASPNGVSLGRFATSVGWDFAPLSRRTFGLDAPASLAEFRQGKGLPNAYPLVGPMVITEIHYRPVTSETDPPFDPVAEEFIEIHNSGSQPVSLFDPTYPTNTWRLRGGIEFNLPSDASLPPGGFALVVSFDPANALFADAFRTRFAVPASVPLWGPFQGRLSNEQDDLRLQRPDAPQAPPHPDAGFVPYLNVESIRYSAEVPWPVLASNANLSLHRLRTVGYANDPAEWFVAPPSPGRPDAQPSPDRDADGIPDEWELAHGLNPDDPNDAALDPDFDGLSTLSEFLAGTDPKSAASVLRLSAVRPLGGAGAVLRFQAVAHRAYTILYLDDLVTGTWLPYQSVPAESTDRDVSILLDLPSNTHAFYRLTTP